MDAAETPQARTGIRSLFSRVNGLALSIALHVVIGLIAAISAFGVHAGGSSGSAGASTRNGMTTWSHPASLRSADEPVISGTPLGDPAQYGRLTSEETAAEPLVDETPAQIFPAEAPVPASDPAPPPPPPSRPGSRDGRSMKLPAASGD